MAELKHFTTATLDLDTEGKWSVHIADEQFGQGGYEGWGRTRLGGFECPDDALDALSIWYTDKHIQKLKDRIKKLEDKK
jgi:hypothetical protein